MSFQRAWKCLCREYSYASRREPALLTSKPITKVENIVIKPTSKHPALLIPDKMPPAETFADLRLRADVLNALQVVGVTKPTLIQMLAIPKILRGKNVLCAAETGSGKTLAYLAPLINRLRDEEEHHGMVARLRKPRALILLPSRDLARQILSVAKSLGHTARFRALGIIGGRKRKIIKNGLDKPVDIAVATPDCLQRFQREGRIELSDLSHLVIDEADTLLDDSFAEAISTIMKSIRVRGGKPPLPPALAEGTQVTVVAATVSNEMLTKIQSLVPNLKKATTKYLHQILPHIHQTFVKVLPHKKSEALLRLLREHPNCYTIVFCNSVPCCDWAGRYLEENGVNHIRLHGGLDSKVRLNRLKEFVDGKAKVLICTDIASRGIDTSKVTQVILYDFPYTLADYIHRIGRTGRVGMSAQCRAVCFMTHRRDIHMAWMIKDAAEKRVAIMNKQASKKLQSID